jgi:hypothetical protein
MKQILILFFGFISSFSAYCQISNLDDGNECFNQGNYTCAEAKYKQVFKTAVNKEKQIAEIKIQRAKKCIENLRIAELAFKNKNYTKAKEFYLAILDSNPQDEFVKGRLESINKSVTIPDSKPSNLSALSLSKTELSYSSSGGYEYVNVNTNSKTYSVDLLPSWCTVQKYNTYFSVNCTMNNQSTERSGYFDVKAGDKTIRVNIKQEGSVQVEENYLELSKTDLFFSSETSYVESVTVSTNAVDFNTSLVPSWCNVNKFSNYITVSCQKNESNQARNSWFNVNIDNKEVIVYVSQSANPITRTKERSSYSNNLNAFSSIGFQSGEIAKYGFIYERGGRKTVGFRFSVRTSLTAEEDILNGTSAANKTEIELGPNFKLSNRVYLNIGIGIGNYDRLMNNDYAGKVYTESTGYSVATTGMMFRLSRVISINGGASFMDIDKDLYKPEITFGISFNLKGKYSY